MSAAFSDAGWAVVWADQRRFPGQSTTFSDVWVTTQQADGGLGRFEGSPPFSNAVRDDAVIATNGAAWLVGWSENDGGWFFKGRTSLDTTFSGLQPEVIHASPGAFDHGTTLVAGGEGLWRMSWRKGSAIWVQYDATGSTLTTMPGVLDVALGEVPGGMLLAYLLPASITSHAVGMQGAAGASAAVTQPFHLSLSAQVPPVVHQGATGDVSFYQRAANALQPMPALSFSGTNPMTPLLATAFGSGTLVVYRDTLARARLVTDVNSGTPVTYQSLGAPVALVSAPGWQRALLVEQDGGSVLARDINLSLLPSVGTGLSLNALPSPQVRPTVAWSEVKQAFLVMWEALGPAGSTLTYSYLAPDGGATVPAAFGVDAGTNPRLIPGPSGQPLGLLRRLGALQYFDTLSEGSSLAQNTIISVNPNITFAARGATAFSWGPNSSLVQLFSNWSSQGSISSVLPRCAALKGGAFILGQMSESTPATSVSAFPDGPGLGILEFQPDLRGKGQHCYAVRPITDEVVVGFNDLDGGIRVMALDGGAVLTGQPGNGSPLVTPLGSSLFVSWVERPNSVRGFVLGVDGGTLPVSLDDKAADVSEHWAAASPNGLVAVVWQSFDVATGRVLVNARIVSEPNGAVGPGFDGGVTLDGGSSTDAGPPDLDAGQVDDAGMSQRDAGPDAGVDADAGGVDAGGVDAGGVDAGGVDAGADAGADGGADAGAAPVTFVPVCGCGGTAVGPMALLAALVFFRRLRVRAR